MQIFNPSQTMNKILKIELMLNELKQEISLFDRKFQESIFRGEKDILAGNVIVCKTEDELNDFFDSV